MIAAYHGSATAQPVCLTFRYEEGEFLTACRLFYARELRRDFLISGGFLASGLIAVALGWNSLIPYLATAVGVISSCGSYYYWFAAPRRRFRHNVELQQTFEMCFSDERIVSRVEHLETKVEWAFHSGVRETTDFYLLILNRSGGKRACTPIPKRVFGSREQEAAFRALLRRKFAAGITPHAFSRPTTI